jgi:hypothetical protein
MGERQDLVLICQLKEKTPVDRLFDQRANARALLLVGMKARGSEDELKLNWCVDWRVNRQGTDPSLTARSCAAPMIAGQRLRAPKCSVQRTMANGPITGPCLYSRLVGCRWRDLA